MITRVSLATVLAAVLLAPVAHAEEQAAPLSNRDDAAAEKLGWKLAIQCWTFRKYTFFEAVDKARKLGIKYLEAYPGQRLAKDGPKGKMDCGMGEAAEKDVLAKLDDAGIELVCFGVTGLPKEEDGRRKLFEWATRMGIDTIVTETYPTEAIDKLAGGYDLTIALHNHPNSWPPEKVLKACKGLSKRIGACADTGHWMRRSIKPIEGVKELEGRIISFHFKDLNSYGKGHDVPWGAGEGDIRKVLHQVHDQGFKGVFSIEYEHNWTSSMPEIAKCIAFFDKVAAEIAARN